MSGSGEVVNRAFGNSVAAECSDRRWHVEIHTRQGVHQHAAGTVCVQTDHRHLVQPALDHVQGVPRSRPSPPVTKVAEVDSGRHTGFGIDPEQEAGVGLDDEQGLPVGRLGNAIRIEPFGLHPVAGQGSVTTSAVPGTASLDRAVPRTAAPASNR